MSFKAVYIFTCTCTCACACADIIRSEPHVSCTKLTIFVALGVTSLYLRAPGPMFGMDVCSTVIRPPIGCWKEDEAHRKHLVHVKIIMFSVSSKNLVQDNNYAEQLHPSAQFLEMNIKHSSYARILPYLFQWNIWSYLTQEISLSHILITFIYGAIDDLHQKLCIFQNFFFIHSIRLSTVCLV